MVEDLHYAYASQPWVFRVWHRLRHGRAVALQVFFGSRWQSVIVNYGCVCGNLFFSRTYGR